MARKPTTPKAADPLDIMATGVIADHKAKMATDAKSTATVDTPPPFAEDTLPGNADASVAAEVSGADTVNSDASADDESAREQVRVEQEKPTKLPTPAAPGDDAPTVFDRRLERLTNIAIEADFESGTAFGDLRDCLLNLFKHKPKHWDAMIPSERADTIKTIGDACKVAIGKIVLVVAQDDANSIQGTLDKKWGVNGETIELKVKVDNADGETLVDALKLAGQRVILVSADSNRHMSARRDIHPGEDQVAMQFVSDTKVADLKPSNSARTTASVSGVGTHAATNNPIAEVSDDALADGDENESGVDKAIAAAETEELPEGAGNEPDPVEKPFGVYDPDDAEWLSEVSVAGSEDAWSADSSEAVPMTEDEAKKIASEYGDGFEARRFDDEG